MAQHTKAVSIAFNDNDGGIVYVINPESGEDIKRHYKMYGKWRSRLMFLRAFWLGLRRLERWYGN